MGNIFATGHFYGTVDFDPNSGISNLTAIGNKDIFIQKLDSLGNLLWAKSIGGGSDDYGNSIAIDGLGNVYTIGMFEGTVDFDPNSGISNLTATGNDIFIQKLDNSGNLIWVKNIGGTAWNYGSSITIDNSGNIYTTGYFNGTVDFDPNSGISNLTAIGFFDMFIQKLSSSGNLIWAKNIGSVSSIGAAYTQGTSIAIDGFNNVYTTGRFLGIADFDPNSGVNNINSFGGADIFVQKLDALGNFVWAKSMGGISDNYSYSIIVDGLNNIYTTGIFQNTVDFDPNSGVSNLTAIGGSDIFIQKLDALGNFVWAKSMGGIFLDIGKSIRVDASGNVYTIGIFEGTVDFDPNGGTSNLNSFGGTDIFIQKLNASGNLLWTKNIGGGSDDYGNSIAIDSLGNVYTVGYFEGIVDFDPNGGTSNLNSFGGTDIFIQKLAQCKVIPCNRTVNVSSYTTCNSYFWQGQTYTASGIYKDTLSSVLGCDSILVLNLTIYDIVTSISTVSNYNGYPISCFGTCNGTAITTVTNGIAPYTFNWSAGGQTSQIATGLCAGIYSVTVNDGSGCQTVDTIIVQSPSQLTDSIININNVVCKGDSTGSITVQGMGGVAPYMYSFDNGITYTNINQYTGLPAGIYLVYIRDANGCIVSISISITEPSSISTNITNITTCNSFIWNGQTYTSSGIYSDTVQTINGCDSILILDLTIGTTYNQTDTISICSGNVYILPNGSIVDTAGTYTSVLQTVNGCDSIIYSTVIIGTSPTITFSLTNPSCFGACDGIATTTITSGVTPYSFNWSAGGQTSQIATGLCAGIYSVTVIDGIGCQYIDSITLQSLPVLTNTATVTSAYANGTMISCNGACDGAATAVGTGGNPGSTYLFLWSNNSTNFTTTGLCAGFYDVTITDQNGCTAVDTVILVEPIPLIATSSVVNINCFGDSTGSITVQGMGGVAPYMYSFDNGITYTNINQYTGLPAGIYLVYIRDTNGCIVSISISITEPSSISTNITNITTCNSFIWNGQTYTSSGIYSDTVQTINGCDSILILDLTIGTTYNQTDTISICSGNVYILPNGTIVDTAGTYTSVLQTVNGCDSIIYSTVIIGTSPTITFSLTNPSCFGACDGNILSNINQNISNYQFSIDGINYQVSNLFENLCNGFFTIYVKDTIGCILSKTAILAQPTAISINIINKENVSCYNGNDGTIQTSLVGVDSNIVSYLWNNGETTSFANNLTTLGNDSTIYTIIVTDSMGCATSKEIVIKQPLPLIALMSGNTMTCADSAKPIITLDAISGGTAPYSYSFLEIGPYSPATILSQNLEVGSYTVYIQDIIGCLDSVENIIIRDTIKVTAYQSQTIDRGETVTLYGTVNYAGIDSSIVSWAKMNPDTGIITQIFTGISALEGFTPDTFLHDMQFILYLNNGCKDSSVVEILVNQSQNIFIPNAFSPNNDRINDIFTIYGSNHIKNIKSFMVFDRWGQMVHAAKNFEPNSTDPTHGWDGIFNGKALNPAVFVYYAEIELINGETLIRKGDVTLIR